MRRWPAGIGARVSAPRREDPAAALNQVLNEVIDALLDVRQASRRVPGTQALHGMLDQLFADLRSWAQLLAATDQALGVSPLASMPSGSARPQSNHWYGAASSEEIRRIVTRPWVLMEVCGGQTHSIVKYGIDRLLPEEVELVHGPGCPVCVTSLEMIDRAHAIASRPDVTFCSFGDMLRVPGSRGDLLGLKSRGSDVRVVYSPLDAVNLAAANPGRKVVFFAIGFETTAPPNAMAVWLAHRRGLANFSVLVSHVLVPPMITAILQAPGNRV